MQPGFEFGIAATTKRSALGTWGRCLFAAALLLPFTACHDNHDDAPPAAQTPDAPVVSTVTTEDGAAEVEWTLVPGATSYNCYWTDGTTLDPTTCDREREMQRLRHRITGLRNGFTYCFAVSANNEFGEGQLSQVHVRALAPGMVTEIGATPGDGQVTLAWGDVEGATSYALYRGTAPGTARLLGERFTPVTSPHVDVGLVNGTTYYYAVAAIGEGGEGRESSEVSAKPESPAPGAPVSLSVTLMEEAPNTLVIEWLAPVGTPVDSYNLYWSTTPNVTTADNKIEDVTSPYVHSGLPGQTTYYYVVTAIVNGNESAASLEASGTPRGGAGGGGSHTETVGNNLALPLLFVDGVGVGGAPLVGTTPPWLDYATGLRPTVTDVVDPFPYFEPSSAVHLNGGTYYPQKSASTWQAAWAQPEAGPVSVVVDWGDNLQSASLTANSNIRVETVLYQDTTGLEPAPTMTGYNMTLLGGSGITESYGTDGTTYESNRWHVFSVMPRLTIEKLVGPGGPVDQSVQGFTASVYEGLAVEEGGSKYGAEINVSGKLVYGYVWMLKKWPLSAAQKAGWWRITFSLDPQAQIGNPGQAIPNRVFLTALDPSETIATLNPGHNSTSIEIELQ